MNTALHHPQSLQPGHARHLLPALALAAVALALGACSALPDKPMRPVMYDFGPGITAPQAATRAAPLPPLALADIEAPNALDGSAMYYRLGYTDAQQLRAYAQARWSMPPAQLVMLQLRQTLGQRRALLVAGEGPAVNRLQGKLPNVLRLDLEEFSQLFDSPASSTGLIRLRATLVDVTPSGEKLLGQRSIVVQRPAPSADAPGGVKALADATAAAADEISQWLQQMP
ncbi:MAG: membrane integrity-associated transporter subunit PqiC [Bdellovibrionales bacterium]|nr:membrane integrity-associated transporter subunit PqiC [Ramlibacter sp.]